MMFTIIQGRFEAILGDTPHGVLVKLYKYRGAQCELVSQAVIDAPMHAVRDAISLWLTTPIAQQLTAGLPPLPDAPDWVVDPRY